MLIEKMQLQNLISFIDYGLFKMVVNIHLKGTSIIKSFLLS